MHSALFPSYTVPMCGRYRLARKKEILAEVFDVGDDVDWSPRYNIAPSQNVPVIRQDAAQRALNQETGPRKRACV
jgi:putative SOS response-associated peptidase YedK